MKRQPLLGFIAINVIVTFLVTFGIIVAYTKLVPPPTPPVSPPLFVVISSTPDPNQTPHVVFVPVTTTPGGAVALAATAGVAVSPVSGTLIPLATDVGATSTTSTPTEQSVTDTPAGIPTSLGGCQQYAVKKGDIPGSIALNFGVGLADLYAANGLKPNPVLQIGQLLIIPLNGCGLATTTPTPLPTDVASMTPTPQPTSTLAPTSVVTKASIAITQVIKPGDITEEGVKLHNNGADIVDLTNWTLSDGQGNLFTFPAYRIFPGGDVLVNTRAGTQNTPRQLFWGRSTPLWGTAGATVTLTDSTGAIQTTFAVTA
jgi:LysM repeat protein